MARGDALDARTLGVVLGSLFPSSASANVIRLDEEGVVFLAHIDSDEHQRRQAVGLGALADRNLIRALSALPEHESVERVDLTGRETRVLTRVPAGVVDVAAGSVTRVARSPISQVYAFANVVDVDDGLGRFATVPPVLPRVAVVQSSKRPKPESVLEAAFYGIGVVVVSAAAGDCEVLAAPELPASRGPVRWTLEEHIYDHIIATAVGQTVVSGTAAVGEGG